MRGPAGFLAVVLSVSIWFTPDLTYGQGFSQPGPRNRSYYRPPTLSPYLDYFRPPQGLFDNYHEFVRPKINLRNTLEQQDTQLRAQAQELRKMNNQWNRARQTGTLAPTGTGAGFFNYSHFFQTTR